MERDIILLVITARAENFNSHAHVERDIAKLVVFGIVNISTHTLTWSVTF